MTARVIPLRRPEAVEMRLSRLWSREDALRRELAEVQAAELRARREWADANGFCAVPAKERVRAGLLDAATVPVGGS